MEPFLRLSSARPTCDGEIAWLARSSSGPVVERAADVTLAVASLLCEREAAGGRFTAVGVRIRDRDDASWAAAAIPWLARHGRRVLVRTAVPLSHAVLERAREVSAAVGLEVADARPAVTRALLGSHAVPAAGLLLHAQHLRACGIEVFAHLGPILPCLQDAREVLLPLVRHVLAADVRDAHIAVGRLTQLRLDRLAGALGSADAAGIARAFDCVPDEHGVHRVASRDLAPVVAARVYHDARRTAEEAGLRVDACGCAAQCHLETERVGPYLSVLTPDLFTFAS